MLVAKVTTQHLGTPENLVTIEALGEVREIVHPATSVDQWPRRGQWFEGGEGGGEGGSGGVGEGGGGC